MKRRFTLLLEREPDGSAYNVSVPMLPGCLTYGASVEEAIERAREAIRGYLHVMQEDGEDIPVPVEEGTFDLSHVEVDLEDTPTLRPATS